MTMFKRFGLLILVNILVMAMVGLVISGATLFFPQLANSGMTQLAFYSVVWGFAGSLISLYISKWIAKWSYGVQIIDPETRSHQLNYLVQMTHSLAKKAGLPKMPEVGVYDSPDINAFATGPSKSNSLVAVSTGLLNRMTLDEVEGVLAHEVAHIANGDMVTMTLLQGVVNSFVIFFSRILGSLAANSVEEKNRPMVHFAVSLISQIALTLLGSIAVSYFSRRREFRADSGGAFLAGKDKMILALQKLQSAFGASLYEDENEDKHAATATLMISSKKKNSFISLFSTHPALEDRIEALRLGRPQL